MVIEKIRGKMLAKPRPMIRIPMRANVYEFVNNIVRTPIRANDPVYFKI